MCFMFSQQLFAVKICLLVRTGSGTYNPGTVDILVDSGSSYAISSTKSFSEGEVVMDQCFDTIPTVQIRNRKTDGWAGSIELSLDGRQTYFPMECIDCTGPTSFSPITADGRTTTWCVDGSTCTLVVSDKYQLDPNSISITFLTRSYH